MSRARWYDFAFWGAVIGMIIFIGGVAAAHHDARHSAPAPGVHVVNVNGHAVTCITLDHSTSCDFTGFVSQPAKATP